jgi:steroid 5-alpha reductase family enzyme
MLGLACVVLATLSVVMGMAWLFQVRTGNAGWADAFWSLGTGGTGVFAVLSWAGVHPRAILVAAMVGIWGLRLGLYLTARSWKGPEDARYAHFRTLWGQDFQTRLFRFLQIQAVAGAVLVLAVAVAAHRPGPLDGFDLVGAVLWAVGWMGTAIADAQLAWFKRTAIPGSVCDAGLWGYTRHPNYLFEWLGWCGYAAIGCGALAAYPIGILGAGACVLMYALLVHISGIPPLEAHMMRSRPQAFAAYAARVPAFWPILRRHG